MGVISTKLKNTFSQIKKQKIIQIDDINKAHKKIEEDIKTIKSPDQFGHDMHTVHDVYD